MIHIKNLGREGGKMASGKVWVKRGIQHMIHIKNMGTSEKVWVKKGGYSMIHSKDQGRGGG